MPLARAKGKASALLVLALLLSSPLPAGAQDAAAQSGCMAACQRNVQARALRARVCGRCLFHGDHRGGFVQDLAAHTPFPEAELTSCLSDPDWQVVREAARVLARRSRQKPEAFLSPWLLGAPAADRDRACLALARLGADRKLSFKAWQKKLAEQGGGDGHRAFTLLGRCERKVRDALELALYGVQPRPSLEALRHLAIISGRDEAATVLEAMRTRPPESDPYAAAALLRHAEASGQPVGLLLLRAATPHNAPRVNRLVTVFMEEVQQLAAQPRPGEALARRAAVNDLGRFAPLSEPQLEALLWEEELPTRLAAARAIAAGEGRSLELAVRARVPGPPVAGKPPLPAALQLRWVELLGSAGASACSKALLPEIAGDVQVKPEVRGGAIVAWADCAGARANPVVNRALLSTEPAVRAGGVRALGELGATPENRERAGAALADPAPLVQAAACDAVGALRVRGRTGEVAVLVDAPEVAVRAAAVRALGRLGASAHTGKVAQRLRDDPDREVRLAAVEALGLLGGARAAAALSEAAARDPESRVRYLAEQRLRGMGFGR